jgi:hypothetical protein
MESGCGCRVSALPPPPLHTRARVGSRREVHGSNACASRGAKSANRSARTRRSGAQVLATTQLLRAAAPHKLQAAAVTHR